MNWGYFYLPINVTYSKIILRLNTKSLNYMPIQVATHGIFSKHLKKMLSISYAANNNLTLPLRVFYTLSQPL